MKRCLTLVLSAALATGACGGAQPAPAATVENTHGTPAPAARAVTIKHGPMTYVMDTPPNQLEKARAALEESGVVADLTARGVAITYVADPGLGDTVIVLAGDDELGRADLHDLAGKDVPAALADAIAQRFAATP